MGNFFELAKDIKAALDSESGYHVNIEHGVRIYTRESENPQLNRNGGDYDFWTEYTVGDDGIVRAKDDWSADFDAQEWGVYDCREYGIMSVGGLQRLMWTLAARDD
jgi:hypothetical protein